MILSSLFNTINIAKGKLIICHILDRMIFSKWYDTVYSYFHFTNNLQERLIIGKFEPVLIISWQVSIVKNYIDWQFYSITLQKNVNIIMFFVEIQWMKVFCEFLSGPLREVYWKYFFLPFLCLSLTHWWWCDHFEEMPYCRF